jgi:protein-disulfide isomerase
MPLDTDCNKFMTQEFHHGSCTMAKYAEAAQLQGKFWEVNSLFFEKKPATEEEVISVLENSGFGLDMDKLKKDAKSAAVNQVIQDDINTAVYNNQIGTPTIHIGNKFEMGIPKGGYPALKQMVIENGGKLKHKMF